MAGTNQYTNYPAVFNGALTLRQIGTGNYDAGLAIDTVIPSGDYKSGAIIVANQMPTLSFDTTDLSTLLAGYTNLKTGLACTSGAEVYYQQRAAGALFESGSAHFKITSVEGHLILDSLGWSGSGPVTANLTYHELSDGSTDMCAPAASSALGASTPVFGSQFYGGAVTVNGTAIDNITSVEVSFGLTVDKEIYSGDTGPRTLSIVTVQPVITVTCADLAEWASKIAESFGATFTNVICYFKKGAAGGLRASGANSLSVTATSGHMSAESIQGGGVGNSALRLSFRPTVDLSFSLSATHP